MSGFKNPLILLKDLKMKGVTKMISEIEKIKEDQKMQVLNETILALLCIDKNGLVKR